MYEAELAEPQGPQIALQFYQRKGFVSAMIAVTLLAIAIAVTAGVLLSNNSNGNPGREEKFLDDALVPGQGGVTSQTSPPIKDLATGQSALKSLAPSPAIATDFYAPSSGVEPKPNSSVAVDLRTPVPAANVPITLPSDRNVSRKKNCHFTF